MDGKERFLAYFRDEVPDRIPIFLRDFTLGLDNLGCKTTDLFSERYDSELASKSVVSFGRMTGQDAIVGCVHSPAFLVEQFGGKVKVPEYGIPMVSVHPFTSPSALEGKDTSPKGKAKDAIESYHISRKACPDLAIVGNVTGPLTKASVLMGMETLSMALHDDIGFVNDVIKIGIEFTESSIDSMEEDIDLVFLASATDNPSLFGVDIVNNVAIPYIQDMVEYCHSKDLPVIHHPHGDYTTSELMEPLLSTGIDGFHFAEQNDPSKICELIGNRCAVMGGTDIVPYLHSGTAQEIRAETERYLKACSGSRYIFSCSCSLQRGVPLENILEMCRYVIG